MSLTRRKLLQSSALAAGITALGVPWVRAETAATAPVTQPRRFIFIRFANGQRPHELALPSFSDADKAKDAKKEPVEADLAKHDLQKWMGALEPHKKHLTILQGLSSMMCTNGHYSYHSVLGCFKTIGHGAISAIKRATIDFELAKLFPSPFGHIELSLTGDYHTYRTGIVSGYSAPAPFQQNYCYADPQTAMNELFKSVSDPASIERENRRLNFVRGVETDLARDLTGYERLKLSGQVDSLEAFRKRNELVAQKADLIKKYMPTIDAVHANGGKEATSHQKMKAMTDVLVASLATGLTNVVTYTIDHLSTPMVGIPGNEGDIVSIHALGHNEGYSGVAADLIREKIRIMHLEQVAAIVDRLKKIPEGKGTMFDNTMVMYFPEGGETHHGLGTESPWVILAGDNCRLDIAGRYIRLPYHGKEGHQTLGNWYTTLLNAHGNPIEHYGDLDLEMSRLKLNQKGAIKRFLA